MKHILIIDDDIHINEMLDKVLKQEGYQVSHAYSGTEALLLLSNCRPDLILLDLMLPGLSGEEVLPQISGIPVIVMSAAWFIRGRSASTDLRDTSHRYERKSRCKREGRYAVKWGSRLHYQAF